MVWVFAFLILSGASKAFELDVNEYYSSFSHPTIYIVGGKQYFLDKKMHYTRLIKINNKNKEDKLYEYYSKIPVERK